MPQKITNPADLNKLRDQAKSEIELRSGPRDIQITVHMGTCGIAAGARDVLTALSAEILQANVKNTTVRRAGCAGLCDQEPMLTLVDQTGQEYRYVKLDREKIHRLVHEHIIGGQPVVEYFLHV